MYHTSNPITTVVPTPPKNPPIITPARSEVDSFRGEGEVDVVGDESERVSLAFGDPESVPFTFKFMLAGLVDNTAPDASTISVAISYVPAVESLAPPGAS